MRISGGNQLWRNLGGGRFEDMTAQAGVAMAGKVSVGASFADINNDGRPDLLVTTVRQGLALFRNEGGGRFRDITSESGVSVGKPGHGSGAVFFDYDRDGKLDLLSATLGCIREMRRAVPGSTWVVRMPFRAGSFRSAVRRARSFTIGVTVASRMPRRRGD